MLASQNPHQPSLLAFEPNSDSVLDEAFQQLARLMDTSLQDKFSDFLMNRLLELETLRNTVVSSFYPTSAESYRAMLLEAMNDMLNALSECIANNWAVGLAYARSAKIEFDFASLARGITH